MEEVPPLYCNYQKTNGVIMKEGALKSIGVNKKSKKAAIFLENHFFGLEIYFWMCLNFFPYTIVRILSIPTDF